MRNSNLTEIEWIVATNGAGQPIIEVAPLVTANTNTSELGHKQYEISNHLGDCASPYASPKRITNYPNQAAQIELTGDDKTIYENLEKK